MEIKIRKASRKDINVIVSLARKLADYHRKIDKFYKGGNETLRGFKKTLTRSIGKKNIRILIAETNGKIVGYFIGRIEKSKPIFVPEKIGKISDAFIDKKYRRKGVGKKLFFELLKWFKKNKIKYLQVSVDSRNVIGVSFWRKLGFKEFMKRMKMKI